MDERVWVCDACGAANHHARVRVEKGQRFKEVVLWCHGCQAPRDPNKKPISLAEAKSKPAYIARPHSPTYMSVQRRVDRRLMISILENARRLLLPSRPLNPEHFGEWAYAGLVVAQSGEKYVPYSPQGFAGPGSDVPIGILYEPYDMYSGSAVATPLKKGTVFERHCYVHGQLLGQISEKVKKALPGVEWT